MNSVRLVGLWVAVVLLSACGRSGNDASASSSVASMPALQGVYRAAGGETLTFNAGGGVLGTAGRGTYTADGTKVVLSMGGTVIPGERTDADTITFHPPNRPDAVFYRLGSASAQTAQAAPRPTPPARPPRPSPDRSTPPDRYTPVADARTLRLLQLAFAPGPVSDDDKLALVPEAQNVADAFARRDLAAKALPALNASLETERANRYRRMDVDTNGPGPNDASGLRAQWWLGDTGDGPVRLGPYDLTAHGFPMPCPASSTVYTAAGNIDFHPEASATAERCFLPVADETVARRIESVRAAGGRFPLKATASFFVAGSTGNQLDAVLTHLDLTVMDPGDRTGATPLARLSFDP